MKPGTVQMKPVAFLGDSLARVRDFPREAGRAVGYQLDRVQRGLEPDDWKPMPAVGMEVREIRVRDRTGAFRVIYLATMAEAVYVLNAFQKKSRQSPRLEIQVAAGRLGELKRRR
jgi:phage-related protein